MASTWEKSENCCEALIGLKMKEKLKLSFSGLPVFHGSGRKSGGKLCILLQTEWILLYSCTKYLRSLILTIMLITKVSHLVNVCVYFCSDGLIPLNLWRNKFEVSLEVIFVQSQMIMLVGKFKIPMNYYAIIIV